MLITTDDAAWTVTLVEVGGHGDAADKTWQGEQAITGDAFTGMVKLTAVDDAGVREGPRAEGLQLARVHLRNIANPATGGVAFVPQAVIGFRVRRYRLTGEAEVSPGTGSSVAVFSLNKATATRLDADTASVTIYPHTPEALIASFAPHMLVNLAPLAGQVDLQLDIRGVYPRGQPRSLPPGTTLTCTAIQDATLGVEPDCAHAFFSGAESVAGVGRVRVESAFGAATAAVPVAMLRLPADIHFDDPKLSAIQGVPDASDGKPAYLHRRVGVASVLRRRCVGVVSARMKGLCRWRGLVRVMCAATDVVVECDVMMSWPQLAPATVFTDSSACSHSTAIPCAALRCPALPYPSLPWPSCPVPLDFSFPALPIVSLPASLQNRNLH